MTSWDRLAMSEPLEMISAGSALNAPGEVLVFPMGVEYAQNLGKQLSAPRIVTAPAGVVPINGNGRGH